MSSQDSFVLPRKMLVAIDGSDESLAAANYGIEVARKFGAEIFALNVVLVPQYVSEDVSNRLKKELTSRGETALTKVRRAAEEKSVVVHHKIQTTTKSVVTTICETATNEGAGLIIMGTGGTGGVAKLLLGSTAIGVSREASCPVLLVR